MYSPSAYSARSALASTLSTGLFAALNNLWTILFFAEYRITPGSHPSYRHEEPASPTTYVTLLTGGLLVRIQPEEPAP